MIASRLLAALALAALSTGDSYAAPLKLGQEVVPAGEAQAIATITKMIEMQVRKDFEENGLARRDAHAKHHGCVNATFTVSPTLAKQHPDLAVGVFAHARSYPAIIRYSNGAGKVADDREGDGRGMAIKLMDVPGDKLMEDEQHTQDFLMINHPVFFVRNAADYVEFTKAAATGNPRPFFFALIPPTARLHEFGIANAIRKKKVKNPLAIEYWSMTPVMNGSRAIKYMAAPCKGQEFVTVQPDANQLRNAMERQLQLGDVCYDFLVQVQTDARRMPIEDPTIEWSTARSPYVAVARIEIKKQGFTGEAQLDACEHLSYTPWHSVAEHRPVGGIQRVRKVVYKTISDLRHRLNRRNPAEPRP